MKHCIFRSIVMGVALGALTFMFVPSLFAAQSHIGKELFSANQRPVTNAMLKIAKATGAVVAANVSFVVEGLDYGDVIVAVIMFDSVAAEADWEIIPLDSLYWQDPVRDTIACGLATTNNLLIFYIEVTD